MRKSVWPVAPARLLNIFPIIFDRSIDADRNTATFSIGAFLLSAIVEATIAGGCCTLSSATRVSENVLGSSRPFERFEAENSGPVAEGRYRLAASVEKCLQVIV